MAHDWIGASVISTPCLRGNAHNACLAPAACSCSCHHKTVDAGRADLCRERTGIPASASLDSPEANALRLQFARKLGKDYWQNVEQVEQQIRTVLAAS